MSTSNYHETVYDLISTQCHAGRRTTSLAETLGLAQIQIHAFAAELALPAEEQDAERLLQQLVSLGAVAVDAAALQVLPALEKEGA